MKRTYTKLLALCSSICICFAALGGCKANSTESAIETQVSTQMESMEAEFTEAEFMEQVSSDAEQIEKEGNIYDGDGYRKYGGFGYQITALRLYDSYDDLQIQNYDEKKVCEPAHYYPEASYACLELQVTNEGGVEKTLYPSAIHLVCAENGMRGEPENDISQGWCNVSRTIYVDGIENSQDDSKNSCNPVIGPGETVTLRLYYEYHVETVTEDDKYLVLNIKDRFENPDYYIELRGAISSGNPEYIYDITKDREHIYLKCTPVEEY